MIGSETLLAAKRVGSAIEAAAQPRRAVATLVEASFDEPYIQDLLLCFFVSAKPFLDGAILRVNANNVPRAFRLSRDLAERIAALGVRRGDALCLGVNRAPAGAEFVASIERLVVSAAPGARQTIGRAPQLRVIASSRSSRR